MGSGKSADSLFHFTPSIDNLLGIIANGFQPRYCQEDTSGWLGVLGKTEMLPIAFPMVCFCDIPLTRAKSHMDTYGKFGIGLEKEWGRKAGISPVAYVINNTPFVNFLSELSGKVMEVLIKDGYPQKDESAAKALTNIPSFLKTYEGMTWRSHGAVAGVRFYDEQEWRYIPPLRKGGHPPMLSMEDFANVEKRTAYQNLITPDYYLKFNLEDITNVIIESENQIALIMDKFLQLYPELTTSQQQILAAKFSIYSNLSKNMGLSE